MDWVGSCNERGTGGNLVVVDVDVAAAAVVALHIVVIVVEWKHEASRNLTAWEFADSRDVDVVGVLAVAAVEVVGVGNKEQSWSLGSR